MVANAQVATFAQLDVGVEMELATYRHRVFVEQLGWDLPLQEVGKERDQFDCADTVYAWVRDPRGRVCGCARLLPTTGPYLLQQVFPFLLDGAEPPRSAQVWELSRYTTEPVDNGADSAAAAQERFRSLLRAVVETALQRGAERLITFSYVGVERIARRFGLHVHRAGAIHMIDGRATLAFWIEMDAQTLTALGLTSPPHQAAMVSSRLTC